MTDEEIFVAVRSVLLGTTSPPVRVLQQYQPTTEGRVGGKVLYMYLLPTKRYGWLKRADRSDGSHVETQQMESTMQITALDPDGYPMDLCRAASDRLQSDEGLAALAVLGLRPLRVTDLRNPFFKNDRDDYEASPNFDIVLEHKHVREYGVPDAVPKFDGIYGV